MQQGERPRIDRLPVYQPEPGLRRMANKDILRNGQLIEKDRFLMNSCYADVYRILRIGECDRRTVDMDFSLVAGIDTGEIFLRGWTFRRHFHQSMPSPCRHRGRYSRRSKPLRQETIWKCRASPGAAYQELALALQSGSLILPNRKRPADCLPGLRILIEIRIFWKTGLYSWRHRRTGQPWRLHHCHRS